MSVGTKLKTVTMVSALVGSVAFGAYTIKNEFFADMGVVHAAQVSPPQAIPVSVIQVRTEPIRLWSDFTGRLTAVDQVELRPQVSGRIDEIHFEDGQKVTKGDVLIVIDPRPYAAAVAEAKAEVNAAVHSVDLASKQRVRAERLVKTQHISRSILDERVSSHTIAISQMNAAKAKLEQAEIDLNHAFVKAPITGRLSRAEITEGNLVEAGSNAPVLTTIVATDEIYAEFDVDERTYLRHVHNIAKVGEPAAKLPVELTIDAGELRSYRGHIHAFDNQIDPATGTIRARAIFSNDDGSLIPGIFAQVRLGSPDVNEVVLLGAGDIGTDQDRKFVYVVDDSNQASYREVTLGASIAGKRIIKEGLTAGEQVIVDGLMTVRPGMVVDPRILPVEDSMQLSNNQRGVATAVTN
jgi:multidrug efflux system membrane fusion protein